MVEPAPSPRRAQLRKFVEDYLTGLDLDEPSANNSLLSDLLYEVLDGLDYLDSGETPPIFAPTKGKRQARFPAQIKRLQIRALVHIEALRKRGYSLKNARKVVAERFGRDPETLASWAKKLKKQAPDQIKEALGMALTIDTTHARMIWGQQPAEHILEVAHKDGQRLTSLLRKE